MARRRNPHYGPTSVAKPSQAYSTPIDRGLGAYATTHCRKCGDIIYITTDGSGGMVALSRDYTTHPCEGA